MPRIVGIHGIGQQFDAGPRLTASWILALRGGLEAADAREKADAVDEGSMRVAHFGALFRPSGSMSGGDPPYTVADLDSPSDRLLLEALVEGAIRADPSLAAPLGAMGPARASLNLLLETLLRWRPFAGITRRALIGNLRQVNRFLDEAETRAAILDRVDGEVDADTRVLIGHSLGSVVGYEYLCRAQPSSVELFVTIGSPLGLPNVVFDRLDPRPQSGVGVWPGRSPRWVNVADQSDIVALRAALESLFTPPDGTPPISDRRVDNGNEPHSAERYLNSKEVGSAVSEAL
jgi:hypothetical protein